MSEFLEKDGDSVNSNDFSHSNIEIPEEIEAVIEDLPEDKQVAVKDMVIQMMIKESFNGPLPHLRLLKVYNDTVPGCAERLISRMEKQSDHRMELEKHSILEDQNQSKRGQIFGFIIALTIFLFSGVLIYFGHDVAGTILGTVDLVALVSVFVIGKYSQRRND